MAPRKPKTTTTARKSAAKAAAPVEEVKSEVKAEEVKTPAVEAAAKETAPAEAKKPAAKRTVVKKAAEKKAADADVYFQFMGREIVAKDVVAAVKSAWTQMNDKKEEDIQDLKVYIKPEENKAYYVVNSEAEGHSIDL